MSKFRHGMRDAMDIAAAKVNIPGWGAYSWEVLDGGGSLICGCVPSGSYTRGPRKGLPKYRPPTPGTERRVFVSDAELDVAAEAYEATTGCWECKTKGVVWAGWSAAEGSKYRPCARCNGTGISAAIKDQAA